MKPQELEDRQSDLAFGVLELDRLRPRRPYLLIGKTAADDRSEYCKEKSKDGGDDERARLRSLRFLLLKI